MHMKSYHWIRRNRLNNANFALLICIWFLASIGTATGLTIGSITGTSNGTSIDTATGTSV